MHALQRDSSGNGGPRCETLEPFPVLHTEIERVTCPRCVLLSAHDAMQLGGFADIDRSVARASVLGIRVAQGVRG